jgi:prophage DNA circulation protein
VAAEDWKAGLLPASFRGVPFRVDVQSKVSGRREIEHEFAKRDLPKGEDMGRRGCRFTITGWVIGDDYVAQMEALMAALETEGSGTLVMTSQGPINVYPGPYTVVERRERGRMAEFEMSFIEAGDVQSFSPVTNTQSAVATAALSASAAVSASLDISISI